MRGLARATLAAAVLVLIGTAPLAQAADTAQDKMPSSYAALMKTKPMDVMHMMGTAKEGYVNA